MPIIKPDYRTDYIGETINRIVDGHSVDVFVPPKQNIFQPSGSDSAIVLGNGRSRKNPVVLQLLDVNSRRLPMAYKLVYACNMAVTDMINYDYYVLKDRVFVGMASIDKLKISYLPAEMFQDYIASANMLPLVHYLDSGASAAMIAAFDGHKKIFLVGFDGDSGAGYQTVYDGIFPYGNGTESIDPNKWTAGLLEVMSAYTDTQFYRIQVDGQESPLEWRALSNFKDVTPREAVLLGDF